EAFDSLEAGYHLRKRAALLECLEPARLEPNVGRSQCRIAGPAADQWVDQRESLVVGAAGIAEAAQLALDIGDMLESRSGVALQARVVALLAEECAVVVQGHLKQFLPQRVQTAFLEQWILADSGQVDVNGLACQLEVLPRSVAFLDDLTVGHAQVV